MRRRLLIITKDPEFDQRGDVVLGQCEPFTSGWSLIMIDKEGQRETLLVGTYTDLRKIQESCSEIDDPKHVRKRVSDMRALLLSSVTETLAVHLRREPVVEAGETREMESVNIPKQTPGGLLMLAPNGYVVVATVNQPERADDSGYLKGELQSLLECRPKAVLMDMSKLSNLSVGSVQELAGLRDRLRDKGASFALCSVPQAMMQKIQTMKPKDILPVYENQAVAIAALKS
jgi:anti-anti-sigma regulatory factor